ncbi:GlmU family protein [Pontibacter harenae]|uniref:GlmU family protein n=1 Tax=Pontibacter harenae TaxID=2894083 RepID=UPI001E50BC9B|nr:GlmU family protein [Pontibacter harenae]MCC9165969.1 GlmU family protein [Pontibacter harenae]
MNIILFDEPTIRKALLPFTFTRPVAEIRVGILTISDKWREYTGEAVSFLTQPYLQEKFALHFGNKNIYINGAVCPNEGLVNAIKALKMGEALYHGDLLVALHGDNLELHTVDQLVDYAASKRQECGTCTIVKEVWEIFQFNGEQIRSDFELLTKGRKSQPVGDKHTIVYNEENIFIEEGVKIRAAVLNAEDGPIYLGKNSQVSEGALIRGPFALGENSQVAMGAKVRGDVTVGPYCKIGGEVSASVLFAYSNKGHDGYLGNSVIGEWCNLGADTNTSNLKNNYAQVKLWSYVKNGFKNTGQQFCGLMMGDHSKCGINTMFNTGTVVGVSANIYGAGFPRNFVPSFSWGGAAGFETYKIEKAFEVAEKVMARRGIELCDKEKAILKTIYDYSDDLRAWDKNV